MSHDIIWREGLVTAEDLSGKRLFLLRFHKDINYIPGDVVASCVIAEVKNFGAEVKAYGGRCGPDAYIKSSIKRFCRQQQFPEASWWRYKNGQDPYQVWLYQNVT